MNINSINSISNKNLVINKSLSNKSMGFIQFHKNKNKNLTFKFNKNKDKDKFRKFKCREENEQEGKRCKYRLICPYSHETDVDCGENDEKFKLDPELISNYYKSLMVNYKKSIDSEMDKVNKIKNKYACYKCGLKDALEQDSFLIDNKEHKIICQKCCDKNRENYTEIKW